MKTLTELSLEAENALDRFSHGRRNSEALTYFKCAAAQMYAAPHYDASEKIISMKRWAKELYGGRCQNIEHARTLLRRSLVIMRMIEDRWLRARRAA